MLCFSCVLAVFSARYLSIKEKGCVFCCSRAFARAFHTLFSNIIINQVETAGIKYVCLRVTHFFFMFADLLCWTNYESGMLKHADKFFTVFFQVQ